MWGRSVQGRAGSAKALRLVGSRDKREASMPRGSEKKGMLLEMLLKRNRGARPCGVL